MADQDFRINIRTVADTTGIKLTRQELIALQTAARQGNQEAIAAIRQLQSASKQTGTSLGGLFSGGAIGAGIAAATTLVGVAVREWNKLNQELDAFVDNSIKAAAKMRELGESIIETQDKMISQRRTATEPLEQSYVRLQKELIRLKTEQSLLNLPTQGEEWKKYQQDINSVTSEIEKLRAELERTKPGGTAAPTTPGPKAKKGESQALVDEMERNRKAAEEQLKEDVWEYDPETGGYKPSGKKQFPIFQPPPGGHETKNPLPEPGKGGPVTADIGAKIDKLSEKFDRYWG